MDMASLKKNTKVNEIHLVQPFYLPEANKAPRDSSWKTGAILFTLWMYA